MSKKRLKNKELKKKLFTKNRLLILNEDSFEEIFSLRLTLMNVLVVLGFGAIAIITTTIFLIAFTPLKGFIPGFSSSQLKKDATELALKSDSLSLAIKKNEVYLSSIKKVLNGELEFEKVNKDSILAAPIVLDLALFLDLAKRAEMSGIQEWLSFYFKSPQTLPELAPEHDIFKQLIKLQNTLRHMMGEDLITHLGLDYYQELVESL